MINYKRLGSGKHRAYLPDGGMVMIEPDGQYEITHPNGTSIRNNAGDVEQAKTQVIKVLHQLWVQRYARGKFNHKSEFVVPCN